MTTQTATLADFLLARIAEDEALARPQAHLESLDLYTEEEKALLDLLPDDGGVHYGDVFTAARVIAECEAKRRIVDSFTDASRDESGVNADSGGTFSAAYDHVIQILAAVYADHPDYDERWRP